MITIGLVHLPMPPKVGNDGKVTAATFHFACERLFASVAIHMRLQRARSSEALVTDFALVLLLRSRRNL